MKRVIAVLLAFPVGIALGFVLLLLVRLLPQGPVEVHIRESADEIIAEGEYYALVPDQMWTVLDNFTDKILLLTSAGTRDKSALEQTLLGGRTFLKAGANGESFQKFGQEERSKWVYHPYARYWHGYQIFLRPLLLFFNYTQIRMLNGFLVLLELAGIIWLHGKRKQGRYVLPFLLFVFALTPATITVSLQNSSVFHVTMCGILLLLLMDEEQRRAYGPCLFMLLGMAVSYFDLLTYPIVALVVPLAYQLILTEDDRPLRRITARIPEAVLWAAGYLGMWASKWALCTLILHKNYFTEAFGKIAERTGDNLNGEAITYGGVLTRVWEVTKGTQVIWLLIIFVIGALIALIVRKTKLMNSLQAAALVAMSLAPFAWWAVTRNHTYIHVIFTHRGCAAVIFCLAAAAASLPAGKPRR